MSDLVEAREELAQLLERVFAPLIVGDVIACAGAPVTSERTLTIREPSSWWRVPLFPGLPLTRPKVS